MSEPLFCSSNKLDGSLKKFQDEHSHTKVASCCSSIFSFSSRSNFNFNLNSLAHQLKLKLQPKLLARGIKWNEVNCEQERETRISVLFNSSKLLALKLLSALILFDCTSKILQTFPTQWTQRISASFNCILFLLTFQILNRRCQSLASFYKGTRLFD